MERMEVNEMTDIIMMQNGRAKHLFSIFSKVKISLKDPVIKAAIADIEYNKNYFAPFFDLSKSFTIVVNDPNSGREELEVEGFKE